MDTNEQNHVKQEPADEQAAPASSAKATAKKRGPAKNKSDDTPTKKAKMVGEGKTAAPTKIPTNEAEITEVDRLLIEMREAGESWSKITAMWEEKTGVKTSDSTCRKRYGKLKANLARVEDADLDTMKTCVAQVDTDIEEQKKALDRKRWNQVSAAMEAAGTKKYEAGTIEKAYKNMSANSKRSTSMAVAEIVEE